MEHHVSGDIIFAARQYDYLHRNAEVRKNLLCPLALETAEYWTRRVEKDKKGLYHIKHVIPPDEYAVNVDDNIYTNDVAKISLLYANECRPNATWRNTAKNMYVEYDSKLDYHSEFTGCKIGRITKQADVILVSFPLEQNYSTSSLFNDLFIYENVTTPKGPAMTWSMSFINYLELASKREEIVKATHKYFYRAFLMNVKGPFYVWWETPTGGAIHFATGAGGFLQALIFGYAGLRIHNDPEHPEILARFKPVTPVDLIKGIEVSSINLLEGKIKIDVKVEPNATFMRTNNKGLYLDSKVKVKLDLIPGEWVQIPSNIGFEDRNGYHLKIRRELMHD